MGIVPWIQKTLLEKWLGRAIVLFLAWMSGYLLQVGLPEQVVTDWISATKPLIEALLPLLLAWLLATLRYKIALNKMPPIK